MARNSPADCFLDRGSIYVHPLHKNVRAVQKEDLTAVFAETIPNMHIHGIEGCSTIIAGDKCTVFNADTVAAAHINAVMTAINRDTVNMDILAEI